MMELAVCLSVFVLGGALLKRRSAGRMDGDVGIHFYEDVPHALVFKPIWLPLIGTGRVIWLPNCLRLPEGGVRNLNPRVAADFVQDGRTGPQELFDLLDAIDAVRRRKSGEADMKLLSRWYGPRLIKEGAE